MHKEIYIYLLLKMSRFFSVLRCKYSVFFCISDQEVFSCILLGCHLGALQYSQILKRLIWARVYVENDLINPEFPNIIFTIIHLRYNRVRKTCEDYVTTKANNRTDYPVRNRGRVAVDLVVFGESKQGEAKSK